MSRLGCVPPSAGRDVVDRKALPVPPGSSGSTRIDSRPGVLLETFGQSNGGVRRPSPNESRTAGSGDPRRTSPERRAQETLTERVPNGGLRRPSPNESRTAGPGGPRRTSPERRAAAKNHLGEMDQPRLLCATEQVARFALPSRFRASESKGERWK